VIVGVGVMGMGVMEMVWVLIRTYGSFVTDLQLYAYSRAPAPPPYRLFIPDSLSDLGSYSSDPSDSGLSYSSDLSDQTL